VSVNRGPKFAGRKKGFGCPSSQSIPDSISPLDKEPSYRNMIITSGIQEETLYPCAFVKGGAFRGREQTPDPPDLAFIDDKGSS
jgi:hypothetical protein